MSVLPSIAYSPLEGPPVLFGDRGASAHATADTIEAFVLAGRLGAGGVRAVVRATSDGVAVVSESETHGGRFRRRSIADTASSELPDEVIPVATLFAECDGSCRFLLDVAAVDAIPSLLEASAAAAVGRRLWLAHPDLDVLSDVRGRTTSVRLVNVTSLGELPHGPERLAAQLRERDIDAVEMSQLDWNAGMVALFHRFRRLTIGGDARHERVIEMLLAAGIDAVVGDHVDRMVDVAARFGSLHGD